MDKPLWRETGSSMVSIDTLIHHMFTRDGSHLGLVSATPTGQLAIPPTGVRTS